VSPPTSFTDAVRQELARRPTGDEHEDRAELAALARLAGRLTLEGDDAGGRRWLEVDSTSGAVARRAFSLLHAHLRDRPELLVRQPAGVRRRPQYVVRVPSGDEVARTLGILDRHGRPVPGLPPVAVAAGSAYLRGAVLAAGSVSAPGRAPHLEVAVSTHQLASGLADLVASTVDGHATVVGGDRVRMVCKSGATIGALLLAMGAPTAAEAYEERRTRRRLRNETTRLANADAANLRRTIDAAAAQVEAVERVVAEVGWDGLEPDLRSVALARLANPTATLAELGELVNPPIGKSAVHRRLRRLEALDPGQQGG
jgi:DNA-binding protein WhiA